MKIINKFIYSENNLIGLVLLLIIFLDMPSDTKKMKFDDKLFHIILLSTSLIMFTDILRVSLSGWPGFLLRETHIVVTTIHFILSSIPYLTWSIYVDYYIHQNMSRTKKRIPLFAIPAALSAVLSVLSLYNNGIFFISANNIYHRGSLHLVNVAIYITYFIGTYAQMLINKKVIRTKDYYTLLLFGVLPMLLGIIQVIDTSKSFVWLGVSISALLIYLNIQNSKINEDYLTGLYNRRQLDQYLQSSIRELGKNKVLFMIMIDIDRFKEINDTYGHVEGDNALKHTAELLRSTFRADDFIARYAGDEFIVITKLKNESSANKLIQRLRKTFNEFNQTNIVPYDIHISLGYDIYNQNFEMNSEQFIRHTDKLMYKDKKSMRNPSSSYLTE